MAKRWTIKNKGDQSTIELLKKELGIDTILATLLAQRGIDSFQSAKDFFRPDLSGLHDPFLMQDMDKAVNRLETAINNQEKILVYGDYDVDGTMAVSVMFSFLREIYSDDLARLNYYIPDRYKEGYGISKIGIDYAKENGYTLIICLDCGIKSVDEIGYAKEQGIEFIVCDHHLAGEILPEAVAILDPKRPQCNYPFDELCGCGVGFKLIQAFAINNHIPVEDIHQYLDLVAISIAADIVPMVGENRTLCYFGLKEINNNTRVGIKAILNTNNVRRPINVENIVFIIAPRINAAGRISSGRLAVQLMTTNKMEDAEGFCAKINENNTYRKDLDKSITLEALRMIEDEGLQDKRSTVLFKESWHKGVVGIVASRVKEEHYKPTIILTESNGFLVGSARSVEGFDVHEAISACSDLLVQYGGHRNAAGLSLKPENLKAFVVKFEQVVSNSIEEHMLVEEVLIDSEIQMDEISDKFYRILKQFAPFGPGNLSPVFKTGGLQDKGYAKKVGETHLKMDLCEMDNMSKSLGAIAFNLGQHLPNVTSKKPFEACYSIEENEWQGEVSLQMNIKDMLFE
ncbi:MAG: single-stranded-DNA-specific exonuclease RecJ [Bacteroidetes bacterium]|nr:single-stranded-DNA-specific exonuclease RecJ [Bacteroidota bacterium]